MLWSIESCQNRVSADQYHITWPYRGLRCRPMEVKYFLKFSADKLLVYKWSQAQVSFFRFVTLYFQFLCSDWSKFDRSVYAENLCNILNLVYFDSWRWQSFESTCDIFNCLSPLDVPNEIQLLSGVFCYSWLVCLLGFWLRNTSLVKGGNPISDGTVGVFHLCWFVKRVEKSEAILALLDTFQDLHLEW